MIEQRIVTLLSADPGIAAAVRDHIYPVVLRQGSPLPTLVYRRLSSDPDYTLAGRAGWRTVTLQLACWAADYADARDLAEAVRQTLDAYSEPSPTGPIRFISVADGADKYIEDLDAFGCVVTLTIDYDDEA
jgi:hypothetical protein